MGVRLTRIALACVAVLLLVPAVAVALTWGTPVAVSANGGSYALISCGSASMCTVINGGYAYSFNPDDPNAASSQLLPSLPGFAGLNCPSSSECVVLATDGQLVTFNPSVSGEQLTASVNLSAPTLACPLSTQCTVAGESAGPGETVGEPTAITLDPTNPKVPQTGAAGDISIAPTAIACPTSAQCTLTDAKGGIETFDPATPDVNATSGSIAPTYFYAVTCPSSSQCTAVDNSDDEVTFNPLAISSTAVVNPVDEDSGNRVTAVACDTPTDCVAATSLGPVLEGNPEIDGTWAGGPLESGATPMNALSCPAAGVCVAVDADGNVVTAPVPTSTTPFTSGAGGTTSRGSASSTHSGTTAPPLGHARVGTIRATASGLKVKLACTGAGSARCTVLFKLAAGLPTAAAQRTLTIRPGTVTVSLVMVSRARKLLARYGRLTGTLNVAQQLYSGTIVLARRRVTLRAARS